MNKNFVDIEKARIACTELVKRSLICLQEDMLKKSSATYSVNFIQEVLYKVENILRLIEDNFLHHHTLRVNTGDLAEILHIAKIMSVEELLHHRHQLSESTRNDKGDFTWKFLHRSWNKANRRYARDLVNDDPDFTSEPRIPQVVYELMTSIDFTQEELYPYSTVNPRGSSLADSTVFLLNLLNKINAMVEGYNYLYDDYAFNDHHKALHFTTDRRLMGMVDRGQLLITDAFILSFVSGAGRVDAKENSGPLKKYRKNRLVRDLIHYVFHKVKDSHQRSQVLTFVADFASAEHGGAKMMDMNALLSLVQQGMEDIPFPLILPLVTNHLDDSLSDSESNESDAFKDDDGFPMIYSHGSVLFRQLKSLKLHQ